MSEGGNGSRKLVGTLFLDLGEQRKNVSEANSLLQTLGHGINLDMTDVVEKQVKQMLEKLTAEVKKTAGGVNTGTKQMQQNFSNMATTMVSATKVTSTWSGDMLENIRQVVQGHTKLNESVTQVWKNGQLTRVTKVDSDPIGEANRLYKRQTELLSEIKKKRIELTKQQAGTIGYRELEKEVVAREREYAANARLIAQLPQEIQDRTKLNTLLEKQRDVTREIGRAQTEAREKKNETAQIEHANRLYEMQKEDLQELADLTKRYYAALGTAEADDYRELIEILEGVIALRKEEIDQVDEQIAAHSRLKHLGKEYTAAEGSIENTQIEHANGLYAKQRQNLEDLVTAYRAYLNAKSDEEKASNAEWFSSVADRVEETQKEIDLLDVQIAKNSDLKRLEKDRVDAQRMLYKADEDADEGNYEKVKKELDELYQLRVKLSKAGTNEEKAALAEEIRGMEEQIALDKTRIQSQERMNALLEHERVIRSKMAEADVADEKKLEDESHKEHEQKRKGLEGEYAEEVRLLKEKLKLTKDLEKATSDDERQTISDLIAQRDKEIAQIRKRIDLADEQLKVETKLHDHLYERAKLEKQIRAVPEDADEGSYEKAQSRQLAQLKNKQKLVKDIANASSSREGAGYRALLQENERELQAVAAILEALEAQGAVKKSNVAYDRERLEVLQQIQMAETAPRTTDAQADSMAAAQLKNYKKLYELEEEIARTKDEKVRKAQEQQKQDTEELIAKQQKMIDAVEDEVKERTKLKTLQHDVDTLSAKHDERMSMEPYERAKVALKEMEAASKDYIAAVKRGDQEQMADKQKLMRYQQQIVLEIMEETKHLDDSTEVRQGLIKLAQRMKDIVEQTTDEEKKHADLLRKSNQGIEDMMSKLGQVVSVMAVLNGQQRLWQNAWEYAKTYNDALNEIRIVTGATAEEAERMGESYLSMAKRMTVSSSEIASAAVEFWRQGQDETEVNRRLEETIKYAKISGLEFQTAAELVTAATNSMDLSADRVVDVFAYLGDASASGADEIGTAMQKASAAAQEFGLSFEWLGSYIAVISEKTRLAPEVIGTSINAMLARLHAIRSTGYNSEDETKVNDIAKALDRINVKLFDQEGRWRSTTDIFEDVARQWNTIDGQTKAYIATTMAGTRQQNYFLTLMNDLSKGVEGGSRAWELYAGAMNAAGTATEKYGVWQESVTAAQNRMKASLEEMYSLLDSEAMVGFYNMAAGLIDFFTKATEASNGLNVTIPVLGGALVGLVAIFLQVKAAIAGTTGAFAVLKAVISAHPIGALFAAVAVGIGLFTGLAAAFGSSAERYEAAAERMNEASAAIEGLEEKQRRLSESFEQLATNQNKTSVEEAEYTKLLKDMASISPVAKRAVDDFTAGIISQAEAAEILNDELERNLRLEKEKKKQAAEQRYMNWEPSEASKERSKTISMKDLAMNLGFNADGSFQISPEEYFANASPIEALASPLFKEIHRAMSSGYTGAALDSYLQETAKEVSAYEADVDSLINDVLMMVDSKTNSIEKGYLEKMLYDRIVGDDGWLGYSDVASAKENIQGIVNHIMNDKNLHYLSGFSGGVIQTFAEKVFGTDQPQAIQQEVSSLSQNKAMAAAISDLYDDLLGDGLNEAQISGLFDKNWSLSDQVALGVEGLYENALENTYGLDLSDYVKTAIDADTLTETTQELDQEAKSLMYTLLGTGTAVEKIESAFASSSNMDEFKEKMRDLNEEALRVYSGEDGPSVQDEIKDLQDLVSKIQSVRSALTQGKAVQDSGITELVEKYPQLLALMNDRAALETELHRLQNEGNEKMKEYWRTWAGENVAVAQSSPFAEMMPEDIATLDQFHKYLKDMGRMAEAKSVNKYLTEVAANAYAAANKTKEYQMALDRLAKAKSLADAAVVIDPSQGEHSVEEQLAAYEELEAAYPTLAAMVAESGATVRQTNGYIAEAKRLTEAETAAVNNEVEALGAVLALRQKIAGWIKADADEETVKKVEADNYRGGLDYLEEGLRLGADRGITDSMSADERIEKQAENVEKAWNAMINDLDSVGLLEPMVKMFGDFTQIAEECGYDIEGIIEKIRLLKEEAIGTELSDKVAQMQEERAQNYAASDGYASELNMLDQAEGASAVLETYNSLDETIRNGLVESYGSLAIAMDKMIKAQKKIGDATYDQTKAAEELAEATEDYERELKKAQKASKAKYFKDTTKAIEDLEDGTINVSEAMETYADDMKAANKAVEEYEAACDKMSKGTKLAAEDVEGLAEYLGAVDPGWLIDNWGSVGPAISNALAEGEDAFHRLQEAAFINITGVGSADYSQVKNELIDVQSIGEETAARLAETGMWTIETLDAKAWAWVWENGGFVRKLLNSSYQVLKPASGNPFSRKSSSGGYKPSSSGSGGGGSSSKNDDASSSRNEMSEVEKMLDLMEQVADIQNHKRSLYSTAADMYENRGELTNAIAFYEKEIAVIEEQNVTLDENIRKIEQQLEAKKREVAAMSTSDEQYEQAASDLKALQDAHQDYTLELMENENAIYDLTEAIEEQQDTIRDMEIELRDTILEAIEDREELQERMLQGTIDTENEILDLLTKRYEKERDELLEIAELKRDALQEELDLLDEQLQKRKQLAEEEDKAANLAQMEAQLARISADPTRSKEQLELQKEIKELREEIAWDLAEKETDAQKENLEEQITNVEDYMEYVEAYYEDLFNHPRKLVEELNVLLQKSDEEIMKWLQENSEEYQEATEATQQDMVNSWQAMLDDMHGNIKTHWDEVEEIISQGDEEIIEFLKQNSMDYKEAGKLQAEAYVDQWLDQLEALKNAYKNTYEEISSYDYTVVQPSTSSGSSSSSSSGSVSNSSSNKVPSSTSSPKTMYQYQWKYGAYSRGGTGYKTEDAAKDGAASEIRSVANNQGMPSSEKERWISNALKTISVTTYKQYKKGGLVDFTGPAWVDGTKTSPEAFLSATQTRLIGDLAKALEAITIRVPTLPRDYAGFGDRGTQDAVQILGDLIIQVQQVETEEDIEKMVALVEKELYNKISRGSAVGGIRIR